MNMNINVIAHFRWKSFQKLVILNPNLVLIAAEPRGPVAYPPHRVEAEPLRTHVLPADGGAALHARARDELLARRRVREVADVQAFY